MAWNGTSEWQLPPAGLKMELGQVHVWRAYLPEARSHIAFFMNILLPDEQARAERFVRYDDTVSFVLCRGILRCVLSRYVGFEPQELRFEYSPLGKPSVRVNSDAPALNFNVSHSNRWALFALGKNRETGIDVEYIRAGLDLSSIAARFFSPREVDLIDAASEEKRMTLFYEIWVRKEAYVKALGKGLSIPLSRFTVPLGSHKSVILHPDGDPWLFHGISIDPDYASALVTSPPVTYIRKYHWYPVEE